MAASLVQGVYVLECDRQINRVGPDALAPPWWEYFNFQITRKLVDDEDMSIFGAIYEYKRVEEEHTTSPQAPKFVIAFRGTMIKPDSVYRDLQLDLHFIQNALHQTSRCNIAMQAVRNVVAVVGASNVWLAGHSLGSAMAMLAGREMAKSEFFLETFLFNPPFFSAPIERIRGKKLKKGIRVASSLITAGLVVATNSFYETSKSEDTFAKLSPWFPWLFVNSNDHICSEYVGYFEHREKMEEMGVGIIEKLATKNSITDLFFKALGGESEILHLIPSANLTINMSPYTDFKSSHCIHQWWRQDLNLKNKRYEYS